MALLVAIPLVAWLALQIALVASFVRASWWRAAIALFVAPLAVYWGWQAGAQRRVTAWGVALVAYVVAITVAAR